MKVIPKLLIVLLIIGFLNVVIPVNNEKVYASAALTEVETQKPTDMSGGELSKVVATLLGFLQIASALIAVVMIAVTGFRYIIETPEMKNELKKSMVPIIAGILLVFFAVSIAKFFVGMFEGSNASKTEDDSWRRVYEGNEIVHDGETYFWRSEWDIYVPK